MGGRRGRQTVHSSVKLYCKIRRSTVPDTLRGTQSSFADVLKFKFLSSEDLFTHESIGFPDGYWIGAYGGGGVHIIRYICAHIQCILHIYYYIIWIYIAIAFPTKRSCECSTVCCICNVAGAREKISLGAVLRKNSYISFIII